MITINIRKGRQVWQIDVTKYVRKLISGLYIERSRTQWGGNRHGLDRGWGESGAEIRAKSLERKVNSK